MTAYHALVLNLHQPSGNLEHLLTHAEWEAKEILYALDRIPRSLWGYEDVARVHLSLSGTLLETLQSPEFQERVYGTVKCGDLLWHLQNERLIEVLGTGYYHPVLPLIPENDWPEQLVRWQGIAGHLLARASFQGFWPPEMGFDMALIPLLKRLGYRYVLVDSEHVEPLVPMRWEEIRYRPHVATFEGESITVVVRDRELSDAQESGMEESWFEREVTCRTRFCDFPALVTTATDGDNGGWFRNTTPGANFWTAFYLPLLDRARSGESPLRPCFIRDYLDAHGVGGPVRVRAGAWNTGWHHGRDFTQWLGSNAQQQALARLRELSQALWQRRERDSHPERWESAYYRLLRAQTSCNFFWGEAWVGKAHADMNEVEQHLAQT
jgi:4-alpha-glucanotransferase